MLESVIERGLAAEGRIRVKNLANADKRISLFNWNAIELNMRVKPKKQIKRKNCEGTNYTLQLVKYDIDLKIWFFSAEWTYLFQRHHFLFLKTVDKRERQR